MAWTRKDLLSMRELDAGEITLLIDTTRLGLRVKPSQVKVHLVPSASAAASGTTAAKH